MVRQRGHTEEQMLAASRHADGGTTVVEVCWKGGVRDQTFDLWTRMYVGTGWARWGSCGTCGKTSRICGSVLHPGGCAA